MLLTVVLEVAIILIFLGLSLTGYKNGLFKMAAKPAKAVISLLVSFLFYSWVGEKIIAPLIASPTKSYLSEYLSLKCPELCDLPALPKIIKISAAIFDLPLLTDEGGKWTSIQIIEILAAPLILTVSRIIAFVLLLIVTRLVLGLVIRLISRLFNLGILGQINRILGVLLSGFLGVIATWIFVITFDYLLRLGNSEGWFSVTDFRSGPLYRLFLELSPLKIIFKI